jgi:hypothetical protein
VSADGSNGRGTHASGAHTGGIGELPSDVRWPAPPQVVELAEACVRYVERALGVRPDYQLETLPLVDHWVAQARGAAPGTRGPEAPVATVVAHAAGAYFGEVVRRRHAAWWSVEGDEPRAWEVQLEPAFLSLRPIDVVTLALRPSSDAAAAPAPAAVVADGADDADEADAEEVGGELTLLELDEDDRPAVAARLAELPEVSEEEYRSLATLIEVIDIAVEAVRSRRLGAGESEPHLSPEDYQRES